MPAKQLPYHKQELAKLAEKGWIEPTFLFTCAPLITVNKRDDGTGEKKMRMVVNHQQVNALTLTPDFPMPTVQTILEMLGGAKYFATLGLDSGFHQIWMVPEVWWETAFHSVLGLFEYKAMPFGLDGAPATFQVNIKSYLQLFLGGRAIAYLNGVLIYSSDLDWHVTLLRDVLSSFLPHQLYPKFAKCNFDHTELKYLGYNVSDAGISPDAADSVEAISRWPDVFTQRHTAAPVPRYDQLLPHVHGQRVRRCPPPTGGTHKEGASFTRDRQHSEAVRRLKQRLVGCTVLQIPDSTQPYALYTKTSGCAIEAV